MPQNGKDEIIYLYTLQPGRSSSSYGTICASRNGIQPHIISRAEELIGLAADGQALVAACAILSDEEIEDLRSAVSILFFHHLFSQRLRLALNW